MGSFSFAPRRRSRSTWWQIILGFVLILKKIFTVHVTDTQAVTVDVTLTQAVTVNLTNTEALDVEMESC